MLHIGEEQTAAVTGTTTEPDVVFVLSIGSKRTAADFLKHTPPMPGELENAIMVVEDEVTRLRTITANASTLFTSDAAIREIALVAGVPGQSELTLTLDAVERTFELLAALTLGRPASSRGNSSQRRIRCNTFNTSRAYASLAICVGLRYNLTRSWTGRKVEGLQLRDSSEWQVLADKRHPLNAPQ